MLLVSADFCLEPCRRGKQAELLEPQATEPSTDETDDQSMSKPSLEASIPSAASWPASSSPAPPRSTARVESAPLGGQVRHQLPSLSPGRRSG